MARDRQVVCGPPQCGPVATRMSYNHRRNILDRYGTSMSDPRAAQTAPGKSTQKRNRIYALSARKLEVIIIMYCSLICTGLGFHCSPRKFTYMYWSGAAKPPRNIHLYVLVLGVWGGFEGAFVQFRARSAKFYCDHEYAKNSLICTAHLYVLVWNLCSPVHLYVLVHISEL